MNRGRFATFLCVLAALIATPNGAASAAPVERTFPSLAVRSVTGSLLAKPWGATAWVDLGGQLADTPPVVVNDRVRNRYLAVFDGGRLYSRTDTADWAPLTPDTLRCLGIGADLSVDAKSVVVACTRADSGQIVSLTFPVDAQSPMVSSIRQLGSRSDVAPEVVTTRYPLFPTVPAGTAIIIKGPSYPVYLGMPNPGHENVWIRTLTSGWVTPVDPETPDSIELNCTGAPRADHWDVWTAIACRTQSDIRVVTVNHAWHEAGLRILDPPVAPVSLTGEPSVLWDRDNPGHAPPGEDQPGLAVYLPTGDDIASWTSATRTWEYFQGTDGATQVASTARSSYLPGALKVNPEAASLTAQDSAGRFVVSVGTSRQIVLWDRFTRRARVLTNPSNPVGELVISGNGRWVAYTAKGTRARDAILIDTLTNTSTPITVGATADIRDLWISSDGLQLRFNSTATNLTPGVPTPAGLNRYLYFRWTKKLVRETGPALAEISRNGRWAVTVADPGLHRELVNLSTDERAALAPTMETVWALSDNGDVLYSPYVEPQTTPLSLLRRSAPSPVVVDEQTNPRAADISADGEIVVYDQHNEYDANSFRWRDGVISALDNGHESSWAPTISGDGKWFTVVSTADIRPDVSTEASRGTYQMPWQESVR